MLQRLHSYLSISASLLLAAAAAITSSCTANVEIARIVNLPPLPDDTIIPTAAAEGTLIARRGCVLLRQKSTDHTLVFADTISLTPDRRSVIDRPTRKITRFGRRAKITTGDSDQTALRAIAERAQLSACPSRYIAVYNIEEK